MNLIKKLIANQNKQALDIKNNQKEIDSSNMRMLYTMLLVGCVAFAVFFVISLFVKTLNDLTILYGIMFIVMLIYSICIKFLLKYIRVVWLFYIGYGIMVVYSIYASAFITPDFSCVIILFFLFQVPIVILDAGWRVNLFDCCYLLLYLICAVPFKNNILIADELLNCALFTVVAIVLGTHMRKAKIENFELSRQALLREKTDYLTGLGNRKKLMEDLGNLKSLQNVTILMLDIDNFKLYNDTYGHQKGDECLKQICIFLKNFGQEQNTCFYRYGGEEFVGIVKEDANPGLVFCKQINQAICDLNIPHKAVENGIVTVSIGISDNKNLKSNEYEKLLTQADIALYNAKARGRNTSVKYSVSMGTRIEH